MPEIVIGSVKGPVGTAFASDVAEPVGHTRFFVICDLNQMVRRAMMMTSKVTISSARLDVELFGGVVQAAIGDADR